MSSKKWLIGLAIPLVIAYVFAFSYVYAVAYRIPAMERHGSWLLQAPTQGTPPPSLEYVLSPAMAQAISNAKDPQEKKSLESLRAAAEDAVNGAHGEGFLIGILSLSIVWVPLLYRWKRKRLLASLSGPASARPPARAKPTTADPGVSRCVSCGAVVGSGLEYCYECRPKKKS